MRYRVAVCDDCRDDLESIAARVCAWGEGCGIGLEVEKFVSAESFLFEYAENKAFDILLLDVEMPGLSGIELARQVRQADKRAEIIFITSHFEFSGEGYEVDALHYLIKPVKPEKLGEVLCKALQRLAEKPKAVLVASEGEFLRLAESDIVYAEAFLHYISIHTKGGEYKVKESLSAFQNRLSEAFFRPHRSFLVHLGHVAKISRTAVYMDEGTQIPVARSKYDELNRAFIAHN